MRTEGLTNFPLGYIRELYDDIICQFCVPTTGSPVVVTENSTTTVNFALAKGAQIRGQILDEGAQPLANISVFVYDANGRLVSIGRSVANGDYISRDGLLPGVYYARTFNSRGYINERYLDVECLGRCQVTGGTPIEIPDGAAFVDNIDFSLVVGGRISGLVTNTSGAPLRRIRISVRDDDGFEVTARNTANDGTYTTGAGIPDGTYFVVTTNTLGYVNEVHPNTVCLNCDPATAGLGIDVTADNTVPGIDFDLALGGNISGIVTASDGTPLEGVVVEVLTDPADPVATSGTTNAAGFYTTTESLPTGNYEVRTSNGLGFVNEVFDDLSCEFGCPIGLPVVVTPPPATTTEIDFALDAEVDLDGDGIASSIDLAPALPSDLFSDASQGGTTEGFIVDRQGWEVIVGDIPDGVQASIFGAGVGPVTIRTCADGGPEEVVLDAEGEIALIACDGTTTRVMALVAVPLIQLQKSDGQVTTIVDLSEGQVAEIGSPVVADPANIEPVQIRLVDNSGTEIGSFELDPGEAAEAVTSDDGDLTVTVSSGSVDVTVLGETISIGEGQSGSFSTVQVVATPDVLWPPNHKLVEINLAPIGTSTCRVVSVTSNESSNGRGDGNTEADWEIGEGLTLRLRAERSGRGQDRVYTIVVECEDEAGNTSTSGVTVTVPHDRG